MSRSRTAASADATGRAGTPSSATARAANAAPRSGSRAKTATSVRCRTAATAHSCVHAWRPAPTTPAVPASGARHRVGRGPAERARPEGPEQRADRDAGQPAVRFGVDRDELVAAHVDVVGPVSVPPAHQPAHGEHDPGRVDPRRADQLAAVGGDQRPPHHVDRGGRVQPRGDGFVVEHVVMPRSCPTGRPSRVHHPTSRSPARAHITTAPTCSDYRASRP